VLEQVSTAKYLGLNLHKQLSWNFHTDVTAEKANKTRVFIARNVHSCPKKVKAECYTTLVRPVMEYATTAWGPHTAQNCNKLEQIHQRVAQQVRENSQYDSYVERLEVGDIGDQA